MYLTSLCLSSRPGYVLSPCRITARSNSLELLSYFPSMGTMYRTASGSTDPGTDAKLVPEHELVDVIYPRRLTQNL